ncbi:Acetylornithine deacetylase [Alteracholeplasma palmae J233]|uniref:Acetylornithine deacetylase n=1 Tax=Alteracholeplasma palmae (strain ATCC 49389 / J233) TaxID=1318466 RepID=U4KQ96_ALTPJ|nr:dipeptidase PepV [Alteracholeplasma palmae]CCV64455.1 Acetylornithine deacetylase [Alteracholeplasma palmae J233]
MSIDFEKEVLKRKDEIIKDLQELIKINSELTTFDPSRVGAPFGEGNKEALDWMLALGKKDGFKTVNVDGYAGHIEYGDAKEFVGMIGHLDVVPAGNDWTYPAYGAEIHDGKMYGRGTEDDKGPTIAAYYALKILKELGVKLSKRVKLILGIDEESGWRCVRHYFSKYPESPVSGFIPDADFPLIYAEKGITRTVLKSSFIDERIIKLEGGFRDNMVPDFAEAVLVYNASYQQLFDKYVKENNLDATFKEENNQINIRVKGISAHGSLPELGKNAIDLLFDILKALKIENNLTLLADKYLTHDNYGKKLGVNYHDEEMGDLTVNFGVLKYDGKDALIYLNLRYPNNVNYDKDVLPKINNEIKEFNFVATVEHHQQLLYKDPNSEMIQKLMNVYKKHTNDVDAKPLSIGGGTFARAMPNVVAFGPHFLDKPSYIHQKNEFIIIEDLIKATIIYTESLYELAK